MNSTDIDIKIFRAHQIREWLNEGNESEGLSATIIAPTRALAIAANPYIQDNDPIVAALYVKDDKGTHTPIAYTAAFPDMINGERKWWFSTLWCHPEHQGKGYALAVVGTLAEEYGQGNYYDSIGAAETVEIFRFLGLNTTYIDEYRFGSKVYPHGWRGKANQLRQRILAYLRTVNPNIKKAIGQNPYSLQYTHNIDDPTYRFICQHYEHDYFKRTQPTLNWILNHPFKQNTPLNNRVKNPNTFTDSDSRYWISAVKVYAQQQLVGIYILRNSDADLSVKYLYYNPAHRETIFASIVEHIIRMGNPCFATRHKALAEYINTLRLFSKKKTVHVSFSYPDPCPDPSAINLQGGDGDGFV